MRGMTPLGPPDSHYLDAATGWLGLGLPRDAQQELDRLTPSARHHPDVLTVDWEIYARERRWDEALEVATRLQDADGSRPTGWINRAFALHELRRTTEAQEALLPALPRFPTIGLIPYNLACYACQLGHLDQARGWLRQAMSLDGREVVIARARADSDLDALVPELDHL